MRGKQNGSLHVSLTWQAFKVFFVLFAMILLTGGYFQYQEYVKAARQEQQLIEMINEQKQKQTQLEEQLEYNQSDLFIEKVAREQLGFIKSNEILIIENTE